MEKIILFSPVGGSDPMSKEMDRDGSMIHICRVYRPDKIYLYLSKEMVDFQRKDHRYTYCLEQLYKGFEDQKLDYELFEKEDLVDTAEYDYFFNEFSDCLLNICKKEGDNVKIILNVSSGTPQMKSALVVLNEFSNHRYLAVQVKSPKMKMNNHNHDGEYDLEERWECNEDNISDLFENRCLEVKGLELNRIRQEDNIKRLVKAYDYDAALSLALGMDKEKVASYIDMLYLAKARRDLNAREVDLYIKKIGGNVSDILPIKDTQEKKPTKRDVFEYALYLDLLNKRSEYSDLLRAISPLLVELFSMILKKYANFDVRNYSAENDKGVIKWKERSLKGTPYLEQLNKEFSGKFRVDFVTAKDLSILIRENVTDKDIVEVVQKLREVESEMRNCAAHSIVSVTEKEIKNITGKTPTEIIDLIKKAFKYTDINAKKDYWDSYSQMNELIISKIEDRFD